MRVVRRELLGELGTGHLRHHQIRHQHVDVGRRLGTDFQGFRRASRLEHMETLTLEHLAHETPQSGLIFDDEDRPALFPATCTHP